MYIHFFLSYYMYLDSANVIMGTDHGETFDPLKQIGIFGIAFLIINAVLFVSTLIFFYFYKVYQLSLQNYILQGGGCIIAKYEKLCLKMVQYHLLFIVVRF